MKIKFSVDFETPRWLSKVVAYAVPVILLLGAGAFAVATPQQWPVSGNPILQASDLNKLAVLTNGNSAYSVGATKFCGVGPTMTTGAISYNGATGYAGAKAMCEASVGCGNSKTAHMCTSEEITRSLQVGISVASGWYSAGYSTYYPNAGVQDCNGWTYGTNGILAPVFSNPSTPSNDACGNMHAILCCD